MSIVMEIINETSQLEGEVVQDKNRVKKSLKKRAARALKLNPPGSSSRGPSGDYDSQDNSDHDEHI